MKIKVIYDSDLEVLKLPVTIKSPHKRLSAFIILDTGSPNTLLNYTDSRALNIPFIEQSGIISIGGAKYKGYYYNKIEFLFESTDGTTITENLPVKVLKPTSSKISELEDLDRFPNILGLDFLKKGYKFVCDIINNEIYLERSEESQLQ